jgi:hypothetical protein
MLKTEMCELHINLRLQELLGEIYLPILASWEVVGHSSSSLPSSSLLFAALLSRLGSLLFQQDMGWSFICLHFFEHVK